MEQEPRETEAVPVDAPEGFCAACDTLLHEAPGRVIRIFAPRLDPMLLSRQAVTDALQRRICSNRHTRIRVLFEDPALALRQGHRLIELARRWPSFVSLRQVPDDVREEGAWLLVEPHDLLWRPDHLRYMDGVLARSDKRKAPQLRRQFDEWWQRAHADPALRQLHI